ncbi:Dual-specificity kinase, spindle pole body (SPB) duplication and spindle checkpoint function [Mortierella sp. GBA43]|nr:Dual-specificity kinase, spindle pole body (SPB) duplication and spindle checkpoint function [Mortierella sp. GBA43]
MTDLEIREKKRGLPPKLQPVKVEQIKDKEAYLADFFGEASIPFAVNTTVRPPKRPVFSKSKNTSTSTAATQQTTLPEGWSRPPPVSEPEIMAENQISPSFKEDVEGSARKSDELPQHRQRPSQPAQQESLQEQPVDQGKILTEENPDIPTEPKAFQESIWKRESSPTNNDIKDSYKINFEKVEWTAQVFQLGCVDTSMQITESFQMFNVYHADLSLLLSCFYQGRPQRETIVNLDDQDEPKDDSGNLTGDLRVDTEKKDSQNVSSGVHLTSPSPDTQDLAMDDISVGQVRGRQGINRDYEGSVSAPKKIRLDNEHSSDSKEIPQQMEASHMEVKRPEPQVAPGSSTSQPVTIQTHPTDLPRDPVAIVAVREPRVIIDLSETSAATKNASRVAESRPIDDLCETSAATKNAARVAESRPEDNPQAPQVYHNSKANPSAQNSGQACVPHKVPPSEGIAAIAQSLAVGSARGAPIPKPSIGGPSHIDFATQRQVGGLVNPAQGPPLGPPLYHPNMASGQGEMGNRGYMMVNNRLYSRLGMIGTGGSSKVYKVLGLDSRILALKKVPFKKAEQAAISSYVNEVKLLQRLAGNKRIIRLLDAEINYDKGYLNLVMEFGEIDLAHMLISQRLQEFDIHFIGTYWRQMLEAVQVIHDEKIVHTDLKPANFLLVEGSLKLIDFGIAHAIANDTTNVHREGQLGTVNYMAPEACMTLPTEGGVRKLGRPSDVWSLGCILYQMVYGKTPFSDIVNVFQKMNVISSPGLRIEFPATVPSPLQLKKAAPVILYESNGQTTTGPPPPATTGEKTEKCGSQTTIAVDLHLIRIMKGCLAREPKDRLTIPDMLQDPFLHPYRCATSPCSLDASGSSSNTVTMDMDTLREVIESSMVLGVKSSGLVNHSDGSKETSLFSADAIQSATKDAMLLLQRKRSGNPQ